MTTKTDWLTTNHVESRRQGSGVWASFLVSTLGVAIMMPGLLLQGVATRTRPGELDGDDTVPPVVGPTPGEAAQFANGNGNGVNGSGSEPESVAAAEPIHAAAPPAAIGNPADPADDRPGHGNGRQGVQVNRNGKHRPDRSELTQAERIARRRERQERLAAADAKRAARLLSPADVKPDVAGSDASAAAPDAVPANSIAASETASPTLSSALATVAPAEAETGTAAPAPNGEAAAGEAAPAEALPAGPVTFEEIQAAYQEAAAAYRNVKKSLNSAYTLIGRLNVERYQAQYELAQIKGLPLPERPPDRAWRAAAKPVAPQEAKRVKRTRRRDDEEEQVTEEEVRALARRRQRMVLAGFVALGLFIIVYRLVGWNWFPDITDRQAMSQIAGIGVLMQAFFLVFFLFRLGMITGKGKSWLFPTPEAEAFKRRRKKMRGH